MKISKKIKSDGKATFDAPTVKRRKRFAPKSKAHTPKKGKGEKKEKVIVDEEGEESKICESTSLRDFIEAVIEKRYADAHKNMSDAIEAKIQSKMAKELDTPLF